MSSKQPTTPTKMPPNSPPDSSYNPAGNSTTYHSRGNTELGRFQRLHNQGRIIHVIGSPYFPRTVQEYGEHKTKFHADVIAEEKRKLANCEDAKDALRVSISERHRELMGGEKRREMMKMKVRKLMKEMDYAGTAVLGEKSVWGLGAGGEREGADWPTREELKFEGEGRAKQGLLRRLPLPRENRLKEVDRSEMVNSGAEGEAAKMERGEMAIPWRMKKVVGFETFDETTMGKEDRMGEDLESFERKNRERAEKIEVEAIVEKAWLGKDLLDELALS